MEANQLLKRVNLIEIPYNLISVVTPSGLKFGNPFNYSKFVDASFQLITKLAAKY